MFATIKRTAVKTKILHVCPSYNPSIGGVEEHVKNIVERLAEKHDVSVFTTTTSKTLPKNEIINGVRIKRCQAWSPNEAYYFSRELRRNLVKHSGDFDIVHAHNYHAFPALYAERAKKENKFVFTPHYHGEGHTFFRSLLHVPYKLLGRSIFEKADKIICVSDYEKSLVIKNFGVSCEKITIIPNGVNVGEFESLEKRVKDFRIILYVGRLEKYKGIHYLIKVLPMLDNSTILEIVGKGPYKKSLINLARKLAVEKRVKFYQDLPRGQLLRKYIDADAFVLLSRHEAFGISVAEALSSKTPCILANTSGLKDWVDDENCFGIDYPIKMNELTRLIHNAIGREINRVKLWEWEEVAEKVSEVYNNVVET
jgi:glycosyltransferase involved in cell wall biosynthesis